MVQLGKVAADQEGNYTIDAVPTREMQRAAASNGGWLNFYVSGYSPSTDMATTMLVSRQIAAGSFLRPAEPKRTDDVEGPVLRQKSAYKTARAAVQASTAEEDPVIPASVAPDADIALTKETDTSAASTGTARKATALPYCKWSYGADTQSRQSVVEFHNAGKANGSWSYGQSADSDIEGGMKYGGGSWSINGSSHISNSRGTTVGLSYSDPMNTYGRSDFLVRHGTVTTLDGSASPVGGKCNGFPDDITIGTQVATPYQWVGGAVSNSSLAGAEFIGCSSAPQSSHRTAYAKGATFSRTTGNAAKIAAAGDIGPIWVGAKSGFSTNMDIHYTVTTGPGIYLCGTNYFPTSAGVIHAENR